MASKPHNLQSSSKRSDMLYNLYLFILKYKNKQYTSSEIFTKLIEKKNNTTSFQGFLFETLVEILIITKCFIGLTFDKYINGKISETLIPETSIKNILSKKINNGGNISDIILQQLDGTYIGISIKNYFDARNTDCDKIKTEFIKQNYKYQVCFITKDKKEVYNHKFHSSNDEYCVVINEMKENNMIFDKEDIIKSIELFYEKYKNYKIEGPYLSGGSGSISFPKFIELLDEKVFNNKRKYLIQRLHQELTLQKFIQNLKKYQEHKIKNPNKKYHLVPQVPRSGKSITLFLMAKYLIKNMNMKKVLIFTAIPATIHSFIKDMNNYFDFEDIKYQHQKDGEKIDSSFEGIYFCSIQYLKSKADEKIQFLKDVSFDVMISDEAHIGSSTEKSKKNIINVENTSIDKNIDELQKSFNIVIFATGTPGKTKQYYKIPNKQIYDWDYIDINLMKEQKYDLLRNRHGHLFDDVMEQTYISKDYSNYPTQILERLSFSPFLQKQIENYNKENGEKYGFSFNALFELQQSIIKNEKGEDICVYEERFELEKTDSGKDLLKLILQWFFNDAPMAKNTPILKIQKLQEKYKSRKSTIENPLLFLVYLPTNSQNSNIEPLQKALYRFIEKSEIWSNYFVGYTNSKSNNFNKSFSEYDDFIKTLMTETKNQKKKGCILFLGNQGTTGITYHNCDVTISLDDGKSLDLQKQKNARAMTDAEGKTIGINFDMNIQRCFSLSIDMCNKFRKITNMNMNNAEVLKYMYLNKLFIFDVTNITNFGECHESIIDTHYKNVTKEMISVLDDEIFLEELECNDDLGEYIQVNDFTKSYYEQRIEEENVLIQKEIDELYDGLNKDLPKPEKEKVLATITQKENEKNEIENVVQEEIQEIINKTLEVMKLWLIPFLVMLSRTYKTPKIVKLFDDENIFRQIIKIMIEKKIDIKITTDNILKSQIKETMKNIIIMNEEIIDNIREIYENADPSQYRKLIEKHFIPTVDEKKKNAEVPTPVTLVDEMLDKIPQKFWKKPQKVFEPCCGKGNFVLGIFYKLFDGLAELYQNEYDRCKIIIEECMYYADISTLNVFITTEILKCEVQSRCGECDFSEWKFNTYVGDTLELNIQEKWGIVGFDAVIGNPPYNSSGDTGTGNTIWQHFTKKGLTQWIVDNGFLVFVHPPGWRKPNTEKGKFYGMYDLMCKNNQMLYLSIHGIKDGQKTFNCGTRYDWYVIQKTQKYTNTDIQDEIGNNVNVDMVEFQWLPNYNIDLVQKLLAKEGEEKCSIIYSASSYDPRKKWMSKVKNEEYIYSCIQSTNKSGIVYKYSSCNDKGHFGISKVIFGFTGINDVIIDLKGDFGMTQHAMAIEINNEEEANKIKTCLLCDKFKEYLKSCLFSQYIIDWNIFKDLKKDFWKEFV
jgi:hypothetical protein